MNCEGPLPCGGLANSIQSRYLFDSVEECCQYHYANSQPACIQYSDVSAIEIHWHSTVSNFPLISCIDYKRADDRTHCSGGASRSSVIIAFG